MSETRTSRNITQGRSKVKVEKSAEGPTEAVSTLNNSIAQIALIRDWNLGLACRRH